MTMDTIDEESIYIQVLVWYETGNEPPPFLMVIKSSSAWPSVLLHICITIQ